MLTLAELQRYSEVYEWTPFLDDVFNTDFMPDIMGKIRLHYWHRGQLNRIRYIIRAEQMLIGGWDAAWAGMLTFVNAEQPDLLVTDLMSSDDVLAWARTHKSELDNLSILEHVKWSE